MSLFVSYYGWRQAYVYIVMKQNINLIILWRNNNKGQSARRQTLIYSVKRIMYK